MYIYFKSFSCRPDVWFISFPMSIPDKMYLKKYSTCFCVGRLNVTRTRQATAM